MDLIRACQVLEQIIGESDANNVTLKQVREELATRMHLDQEEVGKHKQFINETVTQASKTNRKKCKLLFLTTFFCIFILVSSQLLNQHAAAPSDHAEQKKSSSSESDPTATKPTSASKKRPAPDDPDSESSHPHAPKMVDFLSLFSDPLFVHLSVLSLFFFFVDPHISEFKSEEKAKEASR